MKTVIYPARTGGGNCRDTVAAVKAADPNIMIHCEEYLPQTIKGLKCVAVADKKQHCTILLMTFIVSDFQ